MAYTYSLFFLCHFWMNILLRMFDQQALQISDLSATGYLLSRMPNENNCLEYLWIKSPKKLKKKSIQSILTFRFSELQNKLYWLEISTCCKIYGIISSIHRITADCNHLIEISQECIQDKLLKCLILINHKTILSWSTWRKNPLIKMLLFIAMLENTLNNILMSLCGPVEHFWMIRRLEIH